MLDEHLHRLRRSAELVYIEVPVDEATLKREINEVVDAAGNEESYLRLTVTRGVGALGLDPGLSEKPCRILIVTPLMRPDSSAYERGVGVITYRTQRTAELTEASGAKIGNYLVAVLAMRQAKSVQANEALIVNGEGRVVEGATSNLFVSIDGALVTPPESAGILPGITRQLVLEIAARAGLDVQLRSPTLGELYTAAEVFITSSVREMLPVVRVDGNAIGSGIPGPTFQQLWRGYCERVTEHRRAAK